MFSFAGNNRFKELGVVLSGSDYPSICLILSCSEFHVNWMSLLFNENNEVINLQLGY
jgi:hypothetical protein